MRDYTLEENVNAEAFLPVMGKKKVKQVTRAVLLKLRREGFVDVLVEGAKLK